MVIRDYETDNGNLKHHLVFTTKIGDNYVYNDGCKNRRNIISEYSLYPIDEKNPDKSLTEAYTKSLPWWKRLKKIDIPMEELIREYARIKKIRDEEFDGIKLHVPPD